MDHLREQGKIKSFLEMARLLLELRSQKYDLFVDCSLSRRYAFFAAFFLGISSRIGFNYKKRGAFLTSALPLPEGYRDKHVIEYYSEMGKLAGVEVRTAKPDFFLNPGDESKARALLEGAPLDR